MRFANSAAERLIGGEEQALVGRPISLPQEEGRRRIEWPGRPAFTAEVRAADLTWGDEPARLLLLRVVEPD